MKKKPLILLFCFLAGLLCAEKPITLKIATIAPARSPWDTELKKLGEEWYRLTDGAVRIKIYDMQVLGGEKPTIQKLKAVRPGQRAPLDGAIFSTVGFHELVPDASVYTLTLPFLIQNQKELDTVLELYGKKIENKTRTAGYELLACSNVGWLTFYTKDPFKNLSELKKIPLYVPGFDSPILSDSFKVSGFSVVNTHIQKFSQELKKKNGSIRGFFAVHLFTYATSFYKDIDYALDTKLCPVVAAFVISNDSWNKIPKKYQSVMKEAMDRTVTRLNNALQSFDTDCAAKMKQGGVKMINLSKNEIKQWGDEFNQDIETIHRHLPNAFDMDMYHDIQNCIAPMRK